MSGFKSYYTGPIPEIGTIVQLDKDESHHLVGVLRAKNGSKITLFDGKGCSWEGTLIDTHQKASLLKIDSVSSIPAPKCTIILAQAMPKSKGMELIIQKATEIGVNKIVPITSARTELKLDKEREERRIERWQATIIEACKQSGNLLAPEITSVHGLKDFLEKHKKTNSLKLIASLQSQAKSLKKYLENRIPKSIIWLVGPEGDFTEEEYQTAYEHGFQPVSLTKNVLRVETAAIYALSITDYEINKDQAPQDC